MKTFGNKAKCEIISESPENDFVNVILAYSILRDLECHITSSLGCAGSTVEQH